MSVVIIGYGVVGKGMHRTFPDAAIHDPRLGYDVADQEFDVGFVCVPTEMREDGSADVSVVKACADEWWPRCAVIVIKSTVPPGTTNLLEAVGCPVVMSPEYSGGTQHSVAIDDGFVILGGATHRTRIVAEAYKEVKPATFRILKTDSTTAELVKYGENAYLFMKVAFVNEFARICEAFDVDFDVWRELLLQDPRIDAAHTFVYRRHPFAKSHCWDKDIPAIIHASIAAGYPAPLLSSMVVTNRDWKAGGQI